MIKRRFRGTESEWRIRTLDFNHTVGNVKTILQLDYGVGWAVDMIFTPGEPREVLRDSQVLASMRSLFGDPVINVRLMAM